MTNPFLIIRSYLPTLLPVGMTAFNAWADDIIALSGQFADRDSMRFAIASILIHTDAKHGSLPMQYFVKRLRKSAANQVASQVFQDVKEAQKKLQEEMLKLQTAEDTTDQKVAVDGPEVQ